jgi:hypothetical protein
LQNDVDNKLYYDKEDLKGKTPFHGFIVIEWSKVATDPDVEKYGKEANLPGTLWLWIENLLQEEDRSTLK